MFRYDTMLLQIIERVFCVKSYMKDLSGYLTVTEFSDYTGYGRSTVYRMIDNNVLSVNDDKNIRKMDALKVKTSKLREDGHYFFNLTTLAHMSALEYNLSHGNTLSKSELLEETVWLHKLYNVHKKASLVEISDYVRNEILNILIMILKESSTYVHVADESSYFDIDSAQFLIDERYDNYKHFFTCFGYKDNEKTLINDDVDNTMKRCAKEIYNKAFEVGDTCMFYGLLYAVLNFKSLTTPEKEEKYPYFGNISEDVCIDILDDIILNLMSRLSYSNVNILKMSSKLYDLVELTLRVHLDGLE